MFYTAKSEQMLNKDCLSLGWISTTLAILMRVLFYSSINFALSKCWMSSASITCTSVFMGCIKNLTAQSNAFVNKGLSTIFTNYICRRKESMNLWSSGVLVNWLDLNSGNFTLGYLTYVKTSYKLHTNGEYNLDYSHYLRTWTICSTNYFPKLLSAIVIIILFSTNKNLKSRGIVSSDICS